MSVVPVVVGGLVLVWLMKTVFTGLTAVVTFIEKLVSFPTAPVGDR